MAGQHPLVALALALADLLAEHAVVLDEADDLEEGEAHDGLDDQVRATSRPNAARTTAQRASE